MRVVALLLLAGVLAAGELIAAQAAPVQNPVKDKGLTVQQVQALAQLLRLNSRHTGTAHGHEHAHASHGGKGKTAAHAHGRTEQVSVLELLSSAPLTGVIPSDEAAAAVARLVACAQDKDCVITDPHGHRVHGAHSADADHAHPPHAASGWVSLFASASASGVLRVPGSVKAGAAFILFIETVIGLLIPPLLRRVPGHSWWLSLLNAFSGGIFLSVGLMHLIPHCQEAQEGVELEAWGLPDHYPAYLLLICVGYLVVFGLERVILDEHDHGCHLPAQPHSHSHHSGAGAVEAGYGGSKGDDSASLEDESYVTVLDPSAATHQRMRQRKHRKPTAASLALSMLDDPSCKAVFMCQPDGGATANRAARVSTRSLALRGLPMLLGMSVHTALECLALGLVSRPSAFAILFAAIAAHKGISALALSAKFTREGATTAQVLLLVGPFTLVAPTSVALGHWAGAVLPPALQLLLACLATGTFLYVGAGEILSEEFAGDVLCGRDMSKTTAKLIKFGCVLVAVGLTALLGLMPHEH